MSISQKQLVRSLKRTLKWFRDSGVMVPTDGSWGVAERVLLIQGNETAKKTLSSFPAWTDFGEWCVVEQRRADCCMQTAYLHLLASRALNDNARCYETARNLLRFLYCRSGLLSRSVVDERPMAAGVWNWSHIKWANCVYFDDNSWMAFLQLRIGRLFPELDKEFGMTEWGLQLCDAMAEGAWKFFSGEVGGEKAVPREQNWLGPIRKPHWGSLVVMALGEAAKVAPRRNPLYKKYTDAYHKFLLEEKELDTSETCYALIGALSSFSARRDALSRKVLDHYGPILLKNMDPETGNLPSQHGSEAPTGLHLADTIYTLNWAVLALQGLAELSPETYGKPLEKLLSLLLKIQDDTPSQALSGCWRGMYDLKRQCWGGGDRFEGGANSIYTGWTNAPIGWAVGNRITGQTLFSLPAELP